MSRSSIRAGLTASGPVAAMAQRALCPGGRPDGQPGPDRGARAGATQRFGDHPGAI